MGHDYLDIGAGHLRLNDFHIRTLGHLFGHCLSTLSRDSLCADAATYFDLQSFFADWQCHGPGVFTGTDFNTFATWPERYFVLRRLFNHTLEYLASMDAEISLEYLERHVNTPDMYFTEAQPTAIYHDAIRELLAMIPAQA